jgi:hypothetical protein
LQIDASVSPCGLSRLQITDEVSSHVRKHWGQSDFAVIFELAYLYLFYKLKVL